MSVHTADALARLLTPAVQAIGRLEHAGVRPPRLTESDLASWKAFKGNLRLSHLVALLFEDAAVRYPVPFDLDGLLADPTKSWSEVAPNRVHDAIQSLIPDLLDADARSVLASWARALELPTRFAGADLHKVQPESLVLELPGTGGLLLARALETSDGAFLHTNGIIATKDWSDRAMAGLVSVEHRTPDQDFIWVDPELEHARSTKHRDRFTHVFGLDPSKGGPLSADVLQARFPNATIVLV